MSHSINDKMSGEAGQKWLLGATIQAGLAEGLHLSGKIVFSLAESSVNWGREQAPELK